MDRTDKEKEAATPIEGETDDPAGERLRDLMKAREALVVEKGCEPLVPGITREKHIAEMRERGATEEYIEFIYESAENQ